MKSGVHDTTASVAASLDEGVAEVGSPRDADDARIARFQAVARPQRPGEDPSVLPVTIAECPLHTAMRQVAEAAVTQHVLYAEGVYRPREGLAQEMQVWLRLHELVRTAICPATRTIGALAPGDVEIALAGLPEEMRTKVATAIRLCGRRSRGEGCPLESEPAATLFGPIH